MKPFLSLLVLAAASAVLLPIPQTRSQLAPSIDPLTELQAAQTANDELIKRQQATLKDLTDMTGEAHEARIFARRG